MGGGGGGSMLGERVERLLSDDHVRLRALAERLDVVIKKLEMKALPTKTPPPAPPRARNGMHPRDPRLEPVAEPRLQRMFNPKALQEAWDLFYVKLKAHMDRERLLLPLTSRAAADERVRSAFATGVRSLVAEHQELRERARLVRGEATFAPDVRRDVAEVLDLFEQHTRVEETDLFPNGLGDRAEEVLHATPVSEVYRTGDEVARSLRKDRELEPVADAESKGLFGRLKGLLKPATREETDSDEAG